MNKKLIIEIISLLIAISGAIYLSELIIGDETKGLSVVLTKDKCVVFGAFLGFYTFFKSQIQSFIKTWNDFNVISLTTKQRVQPNGVEIDFHFFNKSDAMVRVSEIKAIGYKLKDFATDLNPREDKIVMLKLKRDSKLKPKSGINKKYHVGYIYYKIGNKSQQSKTFKINIE